MSTDFIMSLIETLSTRLSSLAGSEFDYIESKDITRATEINHDCSGIYMEATVIYFEIKNIHFLLKENGRRKVAQTYTMFREVLSAIAESDGGFVSCYSPSSFLIIYPGKEDNMSNAVKSATKIAYAFSDQFKPVFGQMTGLEYGMGLDHGHIMGTKNPTDHSFERLVWFGNCIYKASSISKECTRPYHVGVSSVIYHSLPENMLFSIRSILGIKKRVDLWTKVSYQFEGEKKHLYQTNHKAKFE